MENRSIGGLNRDAITDTVIDNNGNIFKTGSTGSIEGITTEGTYKSSKTSPRTLNRFLK